MSFAIVALSASYLIRPAGPEEAPLYVADKIPSESEAFHSGSRKSGRSAA
jgi:hypothetical protein